MDTAPHNTMNSLVDMYKRTQPILFPTGNTNLMHTDLRPRSIKKRWFCATEKLIHTIHRV